MFKEIGIITLIRGPKNISIYQISHNSLSFHYFFSLISQLIIIQMPAGTLSVGPALRICIHTEYHQFRNQACAW